MTILIKSAIIIDATSSHHLKKRDILIENGVISKIAASIVNSNSLREVELKNLHVSQGWFDSSVSFGEPGYEERETIENGLKVAATSGYSHVAVNSNTNPVTDSKSNIKFLHTQADKNAVNLYPIGALTINNEGEDLAELFDMKNEGALAFYDYKKPIKNPNLLKIALQYSQSFEGIIQSFPFEKAIAIKGMVHEDINSTKLGLKGIPSLAEELQIIRDLYILEYSGGHLHIPTISTKKSVSLIRDAKKKGLDVSCSVAITNLILTDEMLDGFNTNYKLLPPLRTNKDCKALIKGLIDGTIDGITSDHNPLDIEHKKTEFDFAMYGSIGLESCFGAANKVLSTEKVIECFTHLKKRFNIAESSITEGNKANLTLFNPNIDWIFSEEDIKSTSKNSAFINQPLRGKSYGIFANKKLILNK